jgi:small GTP-binding protein
MNFDYNKNCINDDFEYLIKIVILGDSGVGKSNIITRYAKNDFNLDSKATIGVEFYSKIINLNDKIIKTQFWDTAGQERYRSITSAYYKGANGILLVYDITNYTSFDHVNNWINEIYKNVGNEIKILLIGNKSDLEYKRVVPLSNAFELANKYDLAFIEMSAMIGTNINDGINELIKNICDDLTKKKLNNRENIIKINNSENIKLNKKTSIVKITNNNKLKLKSSGNCC